MFDRRLDTIRHQHPTAPRWPHETKPVSQRLADSKLGSNIRKGWGKRQADASQERDDSCVSAIKAAQTPPMNTSPPRPARHVIFLKAPEVSFPVPRLTRMWGNEA